MAQARFQHRNPVDAINRTYFREVARVRRELPSMHYTRCELICQARRKRREALTALGIRVR